MTQAQVFNLLMEALPAPQRVRDLELRISENAVRFSYEGKTYRVKCETLFTEEVRGGFLHGNEAAQSIQTLLTNQKAINDGSK